MIALEETKIGRLYDIDVLEKENTKISRKDLGFPERKCLLCNNPACQCGRSRKHSIEELRKKDLWYHMGRTAAKRRSC